VDTVGAGDSFLATLLDKLLAGAPPAEAGVVLRTSTPPTLNLYLLLLPLRAYV